MFNAARVPRFKTNTLTQGWAIDPSLSSRFPLIFAHLYATATPKDIFMGGDSGAAYINPTALYGPTRAHISGLPDAREMWQHINQNLYRQFHYTTTGTLFSRHQGIFFVFLCVLRFASINQLHSNVIQGLSSLVIHLPWTKKRRECKIVPRVDSDMFMKYATVL